MKVEGKLVWMRAVAVYHTPLAPPAFIYTSFPPLGFCFLDVAIPMGLS